MVSKATFNQSDIFRMVLAVMTFGIGWFADNQATMISFSAVVVVWAVQLLMQKYQYKPTKAKLTIVLFGVSIGLSLLFAPVTLPIFPTWNGDVAGYAPLLILFATQFVQIASGIVAYATGVYNILLAQVFEKLPFITALAVRRLTDSVNK